MRKLSQEGKGTHYIYSDVKFVLVIRSRNNQDECEVRSGNVKPIVVRSARQRLNRKAGRVMRSRHHHQQHNYNQQEANEPRPGETDTVTTTLPNLLRLCLHRLLTRSFPHVYVVVFRCTRVWSDLHRLQPNKHRMALLVRSVRRRHKHTQAAGPSCPNKRVADWQDVLSTLQIRSRSFKAPDSAWHGIYDYQRLPGFILLSNKYSPPVAVASDSLPVIGSCELD